MVNRKMVSEDGLDFSPAAKCVISGDFAYESCIQKVR